MGTKAEKLLSMVEGKVEFSVDYNDKDGKPVDGGYAFKYSSTAACLKDAEKRLPKDAVKVRIGKIVKGVDKVLGNYKVVAGKLVVE